MQIETGSIIKEYNRIIDEKNKESEIYVLTNELDYFRAEALKLFQENKKLREEARQLRRDNAEMQDKLEESKVVMLGLTKKYAKKKVEVRKLQQNSTISFEEKASKYKGFKKP